MRRPWQIWTVFGACLLVAIVAVGRLSYRALESERAEETARARAALEENSRLALWRLDSAVAPLIAEENANPYSVFQPLIYKRGVRQLEAAEENGLVVPSPLLGAADPQIKLHFEIDAAGQFRSPEVPPPNLAAYLVPRLLSEQRLAENRERLEQLEKLIDRPTLLAELSRASVSPVAQALGGGTRRVATVNPPVLAQSNHGQQLAQQQSRGDLEFQVRQQAVTNSGSYSNNSKSIFFASEVSTTLMTPLWLGDSLLLARHVVFEGQDLIQGCWLDWRLIRQQLLANVADLLPQAGLEPIKSAELAGPAGEDQLSHRMAALPVVLMTGPLPPPAAIVGLSPVRLSLLITWVSLALAALAAGLLLGGVLALSERRAAFVSAVTHELRTPLTTFRMYAEMLAEGMVTDEADRRRYLQTLHTEADRLTHLVENVLAYARLERGGPTGRIGPVPVGELLDRASERLAARAAAAGFSVELNVPPEVRAARAVADPTAVEQILFNLVDNACKYAQSATDRTLRLEADCRSGHVLVRLGDHGPGVSRLERKRLFQPFRKSARDAAQTAAGVGLGLALCRRLARDMGGELALDDANAGGASFVLTLKAAAGRS